MRFPIREYLSQMFWEEEESDLFYISKKLIDWNIREIQP